jgi:hypothetical protein
MKIDEFLSGKPSTQREGSIDSFLTNDASKPPSMPRPSQEPREPMSFRDRLSEVDTFELPFQEFGREWHCLRNAWELPLNN